MVMHETMEMTGGGSVRGLCKMRNAVRIAMEESVMGNEDVEVLEEEDEDAFFFPLHNNDGLVFNWVFVLV